DEAIFVLDASFHVVEEGYDWQQAPPAEMPEPEALQPRDVFGRRPPWARAAATASRRGSEPGDTGESDEPEGDGDGEGSASRFRGPRAMSLFDLRPLRLGEDFSLHPAWVRLKEPIGDDRSLHACALTYISDMAVVRSAV